MAAPKARRRYDWLQQPSAAHCRHWHSGTPSVDFTMLFRRVGVLVLLWAVAAEGSPPLSVAGRLPLNSQAGTASKDVNNKNTRIVGGEELTPGEVPYLVTLQDVRWTPTEPRHYCGGAIYDETTVITAAHCVNSFTKNYYGIEVVAGEHQRSVVEGSEQVVEVMDIIVHPNFDAVTYENDIAILKLTEPFHFNEFVEAVSLPSVGTVLQGDCMVAGWGPLEEGEEEADIAYKATVPIWPQDDCITTLAGVFDVSEHMVCAGYEEGGVGACESDSGSPLTCYDGSAPYLGGVVSWQFGCSRPSLPTVFTNMAYFSTWIETQVSI